MLSVVTVVLTGHTSAGRRIEHFSHHFRNMFYMMIDGVCARELVCVWTAIAHFSLRLPNFIFSLHTNETPPKSTRRKFLFGNSLISASGRVSAVLGPLRKNV